MQPSSIFNYCNNTVNDEYKQSSIRFDPQISTYSQYPNPQYKHPNNRNNNNINNNNVIQYNNINTYPVSLNVTNPNNSNNSNNINNINKSTLQQLRNRNNRNNIININNINKNKNLIGNNCNNINKNNQPTRQMRINKQYSARYSQCNNNPVFNKPNLQEMNNNCNCCNIANNTELNALVLNLKQLQLNLSNTTMFCLNNLEQLRSLTLLISQYLNRFRQFEQMRDQYYSIIDSQLLCQISNNEFIKKLMIQQDMMDEMTKNYIKYDSLVRELDLGASKYSRLFVDLKNYVSNVLPFFTEKQIRIALLKQKQRTKR